MSRADAARVPGARSLRPRLQVVNAWCWDGTQPDAALLGQWMLTLGVDPEVSLHYRNERSGHLGVTTAHVEIAYRGDGQKIHAGEWLLWLGGSSFMVMDDATRRAVYATDDAAPIVIQPGD